MPGKKVSDKKLKHAQEHRIFEFVIAMNHPIADVKKFPEQFIVRARTIGNAGKKNQFEVFRTLGAASVSKALEVNGCGALLIRVELFSGETSLWIGYQPDIESKEIIPICSTIPLDFNVIAWRPLPTHPESANKEGKGWVDAASPFQSPGKWQIGHAFAKQANYPILFLWRCEIPAHFEMHSHVMSNHCAPLPAIWDKAFGIEASYARQDYLAPKFFVKGEAGEIGILTTPEIAGRFASGISSANLNLIFPFLSSNYTATGCLMPMDMEYMHFNGYFGVPITQPFEGKWWYCWNKLHKKTTNNKSVRAPKTKGELNPSSDGALIQTKTITPAMPAASHQETWCFMSQDDSDAYTRWQSQLKDHESVFQDSRNNLRISSLPFYHFEPRRHTNLQLFPNDKMGIAKSLSAVIQSHTWDNRLFFGYKIYTAMGWAPQDPLLKDPLNEFYMRCVKDDIPVLNHCTPVGFYTHDRKHYFDLLSEKGLVTESVTNDGDGWPQSFPLSIPTPDGKVLPTPLSKEDKTWWFVQNYVSPAAWKPVLLRQPMLKLCLAHFGDSAHLDTEGWGNRKTREPAKTKQNLTIQFSGDSIDRQNSHWFLADLIDLVQPDNRVFIDLSYVLLNERSSKKFQELFNWAGLHKPVLLERILWGTDWPLLGNETLVKESKSNKQNMLHRYALGFKKRLPDMPADFFVRVCFLNPVQYLGLPNISSKLSSAGQSDPWPWLKKIDPVVFTGYNSNKLELFYRYHKELLHELH